MGQEQSERKRTDISLEEVSQVAKTADFKEYQPGCFIKVRETVDMLIHFQINKYK